MANTTRRPWIQDIQSSVGQKMLQDQMDWMWGQLMGNLPEKAFGALLRSKLNDKIGSEEFSTSITQTAEQIELLATKEELDALGGTVSAHTASIHLTSEQIALLVTETEFNDALDDYAADLAALAVQVEGGITIWYSATDPSGKAVNDIWFRTTPTPYLIQRWMGTVYVNISSTSVAQALIAAYSAQTTADGKIKVYRQPTAPTGLTAGDDGDLWFDSDDNNKPWIWNGTTLAWVSAQDTHLDATVATHTTQITQNSAAIELKADQTTVNSLGSTVSSMAAELELVPGQITAEVTDKTHYFGILPPALADLYIGKLWVKPDTDEQLWWRAIGTNVARSYAVTGLSGTTVEFEDLSDKTELDVTVKTVTVQAGTGTPSPSNVRAIAGRSALTVTVGTTDYVLTPDAFLYGMTGLEDEIGNDGHVVHNTARSSLTGSETVSNTGTVPNSSYAAVNLGNWPGRKAAVTNLLCNMFAPVALTTGVATEGIWTNSSGAVGFVMLISRLAAYGATSDRATHPNAFKAWLAAMVTAGTPLRFVYDLATPITVSVAPVQIDGVVGTNVVTSDGASVVVDYLGSGWGLVSRESRRVYASSKFIIDENGATVRHVLLDGVTPYEAWTHLYGGGLEIFEESTGEFIGGLCVRGGKVVLAASALTDPRVSTNFMLSPYTIEGGSATEFGVKLSKGDAEALTISTSTPNADPDNPSSARIKSPEIIEILSGASYTGAYSQIDMRPTGTMYIVVKKMSGETPLYTGFAFNVTDERIEITGHLVPPTNGGYSIGTPSLGFNYYYGTHTSIQSTSDERAKHDMRTLDAETMLKFLMALDATWYRLNIAPQDLMAGFKAQQFMEAMKLAGIPLDYAGFNGKDPDHLCLDYGQVIAPLVSAFQSQQRRIEDLERKVEALTNNR